MKFKGNQKQFEHNAQIDSIFDRLSPANVPENKDPTYFIVEIRKRQKLIRIADKSADGWRVVDEYVSDELASGSEDEKRLKKAKDAANHKRRQATQARHGPEKRTKTSLSSTDQQLFRGEPTYSIIFLCFLQYCLCSVVSSSSWGTLFILYSLGSACHPPMLRCSCFCGYLSGK